ncbi:MAG: peptidoglycan-binding protein [Propionibacteriaceae bacterium]|nr:peptidoglycan-binding protein [Propionibacteriaceae bacterium]
MTAKRFRVSRVLLAVLLVTAAGGAGVWAGRTVLAPVVVPADLTPGEVLVEVVEASVGQTLNLGVLVSQPKRLLAVNARAGVVTSVSKSGEFASGDVLYAVDKIPVRAVVGGMPFYRELSLGKSGKDVGQLRDVLVKLGYLKAKGQAFDAATRSAVKAWQQALGMPATGVVGFGELVAVPKLPAVLLVDDQLAFVGGMLAGGEQLVWGAASEPVFSMELSAQQARLVPDSATISLPFQGKGWDAVIAEKQRSGLEETKLILSAPGGGSVCGSDCGLVSVGEAVNIVAQVVVVPPVFGTVVPVAALVTQPDGSTAVTVVDAAGVRRQQVVQVLGSQNGVAVVDGVKVGEQVQALADAPGIATSPPR